MSAGGRRYEQDQITDGVLLSRFGDVHARNRGVTVCGRGIPDRQQAAPVSDLQAMVHKLPVCTLCFPWHSRKEGKR